jgi:type I restriction enzyme M protein
MAGEYMRERYPDELTSSEGRDRFERSFMGMEFDPSMMRIGAMNLLLHGIEKGQVQDIDALSKSNEGCVEQASVILANPPFKGSLDADHVLPELLNVVKTKKTELLFLVLMLRGMKIGARAAVIVPDGVLFGSSKAHQLLRRELVEKQHLQGVISMPSGVFKPYAGVSTAVLLFTKTNSGGTDKVWFYDMQNDGRSLDDKRTPLGPEIGNFYRHEHDASDNPSLDELVKSLNGTTSDYDLSRNDIPDIVRRWHNLGEEKDRTRTEPSFMVPIEDVRNNGYDLSINRYKEVVYEQKTYESPAALVEQIRKLDAERAILLEVLNEMISEKSEILEPKLSTI